MPGPPPKPPGTARRRNSTQLTLLPSGGRKGKTPAWPLIDDIDMRVRLERAEALASDLRMELEVEDNSRVIKRLERELEKVGETAAVLEATIAAQRKLEVDLWNDLWTTPQAQMWEQLAWDREVAQYVRWKVRAELGDLNAAKEARQWSDRLGLNPLALLRLRWEIERVDAAADTGERRRAARSTPDAKATAAKTEDPRKGLHAV